MKIMLLISHPRVVLRSLYELFDAKSKW